MSRLSPHAPRVGVLSAAAADDIWLDRLMHRWSADEARFVRVKEAASPGSRYPELLLMVLGSATPDTEEGKAAFQVAKTAREQGSLVVGVVAGLDQAEGSFSLWRDALLGVIEVAVPAMLETALGSLLHLVLMPGVIRLETEDLEDFFREAPRARLTLGQGQGEARIEQAMQAATQGTHAATLAAPEGRWLVGIMANASLSTTEFNVAGEWLESRAASAHEITVMASCDEAQNDMCEIMIMASG